MCSSQKIVGVQTQKPYFSYDCIANMFGATHFVDTGNSSAVISWQLYMGVSDISTEI